MNGIRKYWQFYSLNLQGRVVAQEIATAKALILNLREINDPSDEELQKNLFKLSAQDNLSAQICLRCCISEQIRRVCLDLEAKFGENYQFNRYDLFPLVLDDTLSFEPQKMTSNYIPLGIKILQSFDPEKSQLSTWINHLVRCSPNLASFLLERGLYLISNWAILNDTNPQQVRRILTEFHYCDHQAIAQSILLIQAYHQIYRHLRLEARKKGTRSKCPPPTSEQLGQIATLLNSADNPEQILSQLEKLAKQIRKYRIYVKTGQLEQTTLDSLDMQRKVEKRQIEDFDPDHSEPQLDWEFLTMYRQQFLISLQESIAQVVPRRVRQKKEPKKQQFLTALELFHCQGYSMEQIAQAIGLTAQYQVSRLMQLKELRADIRHTMLQKLQEKIKEFAPIFLDPELLFQREQQIELALAEQVQEMVHQTDAEAHRVRNQPPKSILAQYICHYFYLTKKCISVSPRE
ncbi:hypothetical protein [Gloeocapsa sp. PCC 73106]|uniref:hypothetical protein n=1 Tax=Gloeocapsa sp. PCC 73106 TaxID=102232 RepID=UPI0002AC904C|nr:hypothetical protein [Gloeocapsa sp. PCC 73106]ELR99797.1 hypothetical protein GLO73106DRAFT_00036490 [Gloeocapsa sp. PCC 73106]